MSSFKIVQRISILVLIPLLLDFSSGCRPHHRGQAAMPVDLECEYLRDPLGIGTGTPRLSWKAAITDNDVFKQSAYQIIADEDPKSLDKNTGGMWDSGKIYSGISTPIQYRGKPAESRQIVYWKVRIWDQDDQVSAWSLTARWETALLDTNDWKAQWIGTGQKPEPQAGSSLPAPFFRKAIILKDAIRKARIYISGLGYYELLVNGQKPDDRVLSPAPSNYDKRPLNDLIYYYDDQSTTRVYYNTLNVTSLLKGGANTIGVVLGNGWYNQSDRTVEGKMWYDTPRLLLQMEVEYNDGTTETYCSDEAWKSTSGPILHDGIFTGELYDARKELGAWTSPGYDDATWLHAVQVRAPTGHLVPQTAPVDRIISTIQPISVNEEMDGKLSIDAGQMISGWAALQMHGTSGEQVDIRFIEELGRDYGQKDTYIFKGEGVESYEPRFTWHAFRHMEITGMDSPDNLEDLKIRIVHTDVDTVGHFECSNPLFNKIYDNYIRTQLGNFHGSFSSDCPHRERLGYTGDGQVITESTIYNFDMRQFYIKWLDDIDDARNKKTGYVPHTAPFGGGGGGPAWGSAYVIVPWLYYIYYGDTSVLRQHYDGMKQWVTYLSTRTDGDFIVVREEPNGWCLGDWATPDKIELPPPLVNTAYYYHVTRIMKDVAGVLRNQKDKDHFTALAADIKSAFNRQFLDAETNNYWEGRQGANIIPLAFGMVPDELTPVVLANLISHLRAIGEHFDTGILATPLLLDVLTENGYHDLAFRIMDQRDFPGFGHYIDGMGATTIWENWNGNSSHSHPMYGSVIRWFFGHLGGIQANIQYPGFKQFVLQPTYPEALDSVNCRYVSNYGAIVSEWKWQNNDLIWNITIPANSQAEVWIPADSNDRILIDNKPVSQCSSVHYKFENTESMVFEFGSGTYLIRSKDARDILFQN